MRPGQARSGKGRSSEVFYIRPSHGGTFSSPKIFCGLGKSDPAEPTSHFGTQPQVLPFSTAAEYSTWLRDPFYVYFFLVWPRLWGGVDAARNVLTKFSTHQSFLPQQQKLISLFRSEERTREEHKKLTVLSNHACILFFIIDLRATKRWIIKCPKKQNTKNQQKENQKKTIKRKKGPVPAKTHTNKKQNRKCLNTVFVACSNATLSPGHHFLLIY